MATAPLPRQQRRKLRRDAIERGRKVLARGLGSELSEQDAVGVALILHDRLSDEARPARAAEAAEIAETLLDRSTAPHIRGLDVGCRKGCSYCCSALVTVTAPELFRIARWLLADGQRATTAERFAAISAEGSRRTGLSHEQRSAERAPCSMLLGQACGIYEVRPVPCRALFSLSSEACRLAIHDDGCDVPVVAPAMRKGETVRTLLLAAIDAAGLSGRGVELTSGIGIVLAAPEVEARWLAGENVFADVLGAERQPQARIAQDRLAALVATLSDRPVRPSGGKPA